MAKWQNDKMTKWQSGKVGLKLSNYQIVTSKKNKRTLFEFSTIFCGYFWNLVHSNSTNCAKNLCISFIFCTFARFCEKKKYNI